MMEPWEALDVDDSDIPFLLRPCKRLHRHQSPNSSNLNSQPLTQPLLTPCSHASKTLELEEEAPPSPPQQQQREENSHSDSRSNYQRLGRIPGPAGAVQSAMRQKTRDREHRDLSSSGCADINPIPTQEYIKRAFRNDPELDEDFSCDPWSSALRYIGTMDGVLPAIPLKSIKACKSVGKIDQVVAIISSCSQNSRGGLMVTLKDPTGTVGAYIHHKVLSESNFTKCLHIGSVLILQKVSVFSPSMSVNYLNIMLKNVVKVFPKDSDLLSEQNVSTKSMIPDLGCSQRAADSLEKICSLDKAGCSQTQRVVSAEKICSLDNDNHKDLPDQCANRRGSLQANVGICEDILEKYTNRRETLHTNVGENSSPQCSKASRRFTSSGIEDKEPLVQQPDASQSISISVSKNKTGDYRQGLSRGNLEEAGAGYAHDILSSEQEVGGNATQNQRQPVISSATLPQWTDEQLAELFAGDDDMDDNI